MKDITDQEVELLFKALRATEDKEEKDLIRKKILKLAFEIRRNSLAEKKQMEGV